MTKTVKISFVTGETRTDIVLPNDTSVYDPSINVYVADEFVIELTCEEVKAIVSGLTRHAINLTMPEQADAILGVTKS